MFEGDGEEGSAIVALEFPVSTAPTGLGRDRVADAERGESEAEEVITATLGEYILPARRFSARTLLAVVQLCSPPDLVAPFVLKGSRIRCPC